LKILLISPTPPPNGGIASWTINLLSHYSLNKAEYEIIHQDSAVHTRDIINKSIISRIASGIREAKRQYIQFVFKVETIKPDVIHLTSSASLGLFKDFYLQSVPRRRKYQ
jgi:hypothetical protein